MRECHRCHQQAPVEEMWWGLDPYLAEVYPEEVAELEECWWCNDCWSSRKDDL